MRSEHDLDHGSLRFPSADAFLLKQKWLVSVKILLLNIEKQTQHSCRKKSGFCKGNKKV